MAEGATSENGPDFTSVEVPPPPASSTSGILKIFIGPTGLRAGWRLLIYLAMFAALYAGLSTLVQLIHPKPLPLMWLLLVGDSLLLVSAVLPVLAGGELGSSPPQPASAETITAIGSNLSVAFIVIY